MSRERRPFGKVTSVMSRGRRRFGWLGVVLELERPTALVSVIIGAVLTASYRARMRDGEQCCIVDVDTQSLLRGVAMIQWSIELCGNDNALEMQKCNQLIIFIGWMSVTSAT
jgi:hypothetical protein